MDKCNNLVAVFEQQADGGGARCARGTGYEKLLHGLSPEKWRRIKAAMRHDQSSITIIMFRGK
jgi:hypothetical protein